MVAGVRAPKEISTEDAGGIEGYPRSCLADAQRESMTQKPIYKPYGGKEIWFKQPSVAVQMRCDHLMKVGGR